MGIVKVCSNYCTHAHWYVYIIFYVYINTDEANGRLLLRMNERGERDAAIGLRYAHTHVCCAAVWQYGITHMVHVSPFQHHLSNSMSGRNVTFARMLIRLKLKTLSLSITFCLIEFECA